MPRCPHRRARLRAGRAPYTQASSGFGHASSCSRLTGGFAEQGSGPAVFVDRPGCPLASQPFTTNSRGSSHP